VFIGKGKYKVDIRDGWIVFYDLKADAVWTEYPYEQAIFWIMATRAGLEDLALGPDNIARLTATTWADMGVKSRLFADFDAIFCRHRDYNNWYGVFVDADWATADHQIRKRVAGSETTLATESVDLSKYWYWFQFETVGSTLNSYRAPDPYSDVPTSPTLTATDTDIADGRFGVKHFGHGASGLCGLFFFLKAPMSNARKPVKYYLVEIEGSGTPEDPYRPRLPTKLKRVNRITIVNPKTYAVIKRFCEKHGIRDDDFLDLARAVGAIGVKEYENLLAATWSALIPTPKGEPVDNVCIVRIFDVRDPKFFDAMRELRAKELDRDEAIRHALRLDDRLHRYDLENVKSLDEAKKAAKEYIEWREKVHKVKMHEKTAEHYVQSYKGW